MTKTRRWTRFPTLASLSISLLAGVVSGLSAETLAKDSIPLEETAPAKEWWVTLAADSWLTAVDGEIGLRGLDVSADMGMDEMLKNLDFAYLGFLEAGYGRWSIGVDGIYAKLSQKQAFHSGPVHGQVKIKQEQAFLTTRLQYRLIATPELQLDAFAGFRWNYLSIGADITTALSFERPALQRFNRERQRRFRVSEDWFDPIIGLRSVYKLNESWFIQTAGDVGGFGAGSRLTWHALGGLGYEFRSGFSTLVGYRALGIDYDQSDFRVDTISHGPVLAIAYKF